MTLKIVRIHNELLGTYGDQGNAEVLAYRAGIAGIAANVVDISYRDLIPHDGDIYLLGGAEDAAQILSCAALSSGALHGAVEKGAVVLAICAGFQILGKSYFASGAEQRGLGLLNMTTVPGDKRYVGDIKIHSDFLGIDLTGFENHGGKTILGTGLDHFGSVIVGNGNGDSGVDGAVLGNIFGTYLHGPVLARNPEFADLLLSRAHGAPVKVNDPLADQYAQLRRKVVK
jgi:CobQ-like glutamine amidotransferase family enzyme